MEKNVLDVFSKPDNKIYFIFQNFFYYLQQTIKNFTLYQGINLPFVYLPNLLLSLQKSLHQLRCHLKNARFADNQAIFENNSVFSDTKCKQGVNLRKLHRRAEKRLAVGVAGRCEPQRRPQKRRCFLLLALRF